jgi:hypothetical protein
MTFYFEVDPRCREPAGGLSASKIKGYSKEWPATMKRVRLLKAPPEATLAGLAVSSTSPLTAWVVLGLRPDNDTATEDKDADEGGGAAIREDRSGSGAGCCIVS